MTPTPVPGVVTPPSMIEFWILIGFIGVVFVLLIVGLITGKVSLEPRKLRQAGMRAGMAVDALYSGLDRRAAIEYVLDEQHAVVIDQERGEDDDDEEEDEEEDWDVYQEYNGDDNAID